MGIAQLTRVIKENTPEAVEKTPLHALKGTTAAIDISVMLYQFMTTLRINGFALQTSSGYVTSHIYGLLAKTEKLISYGISPIYVFDGKPPAEKLEELQRREMRREKAREDLERAKREDRIEDTEKYEKRLVTIDPQQKEDCKTLLRLLGIPYVVAQSEAESCCAFLVRTKQADIVISEDMDTLAFGAPRLLRNLTIRSDRNSFATEFRLPKILSGLKINMEEFVDLCILLGSDFSPTVRGIGPKTALKFIKKHRSIENILESPEFSRRYSVPLPWNYKRTRELFFSLPEQPPAQEFHAEIVDHTAVCDELVGKYEFNREKTAKLVASICANVKKHGKDITSYFSAQRNQDVPNAQQEIPEKSTFDSKL